mmetsp:Transcript_26282/g.78635  ORF Transcript_26282/g.78635 Transcript_26282/m.78635 type:complete len:88 (-) Transcript_26282:8-271(-)
MNSTGTLPTPLGTPRLSSPPLSAPDSTTLARHVSADLGRSLGTGLGGDASPLAEGANRPAALTAPPLALPAAPSLPPLPPPPPRLAE